jgi:hypothetical protein
VTERKSPRAAVSPLRPRSHSAIGSTTRLGRSASTFCARLELETSGVKQFIALLPWNCDDRQQDGACYGDTALSIRPKSGDECLLRASFTGASGHRHGGGSLTPSSSAAFAAACRMRTVHGPALSVGSDQSPMPNIWCGCAAWPTNESSCEARQNAPIGPATTQSSDGRRS